MRGIDPKRGEQRIARGFRPIGDDDADEEKYGHGDENRTALSDVAHGATDTPIDETLIPTGEMASVDGTPLDFRTPTTIGSRIGEAFEQLRFAGGYDHNFVLRENGDERLRRAARSRSPTARGS